METPEKKIVHDQAWTMYVSTPATSYGIFCWNSQGDLFVNSDWGFYGFAWRHYGADFTEFLTRTNADYVVGKFSINYNVTNRKKINVHWQKGLTELVSVFLEELTKEYPLAKATTL